MGVKGSCSGAICGTNLNLPRGLWKTTINLRQDRMSLDRNLDPQPPGYEAEVILTAPRRSIKAYMFG
jgi:hypothetical protein